MDLLWGISLSSHSMGLSHAQPPLFPCKHTNEKRKQKRNEKKRPVGIVVCEKIADPSTSTSTNERREIVNAKKAWRRTTSAILRMEAAKAGVERKAKAAKKATILYPKALLEALTDRIHDKQWQSALQVFGLLREQQWYRPNTDIYIKLLVMLGTCKQPEKACILYQMMLQERCNITVEVYTALLAAYGRNGHLDKAFSVLEEMKAIPHCQPNIYTYTIFIKSCVELGHFEHVDRLLSEMSRAGVRPNNVTYNTIIGGFGKACMFQEMENVLSLMLESQDCKPDVWTMNSTVRAFGNRGQIEKMEKWYETFHGIGIQPDVVTFNTIISSYGKHCLYDKMTSVMEKMQKFHFSWTIVTYNTVIDAYGRVGEIEKMEYFYNLMITEGFKPNRITLCSLVSAYSKGGIFNKITKVLRQMENYKIVPDTPFFNSVLDAYQRAGNMTEMEHMFHQMEDRGCQPDKITFAAMISAYRSEGMLKKVQEMENKMRRMQRSTH
ncbi:pentatricopeptide repeat-containing protein At3g53170 [Cryptomeria japonica]|uniref:pentatricopeptide repeat-containing protein At3g53170 n=1 Tax=Cryptomeria japonica TaxID=3369 RepID=UPI0027DA65B6|nr:pentatricopeptide repeat-containing protein At3g53170 [Cryptomeria japonica]XP_057820885.2 pentatricopeptide repeat-containing protein At3g53170 [Cryptomeria japonica]XP_057820887.2 pentatricopeptide repeat-containing protein At3g53170 [Cryptomeria japonica]